MQTQEYIKRIVKTIPAYLTLKEAELLFDLAKNTKGTIVEIGSWWGGSTILLAKASGQKVYSIDFHRVFGRDTFPAFEKNIKKEGVEKQICSIVKHSDEAAKDWDKPISLLFLDGGHTYHQIKKDIRFYEKHLVKDGLIIIHDFRNSKSFWYAIKRKMLMRFGITMAVKEHIYSGRFKDIKIVDRMIVARKVRGANFFDRIKENLFFPIGMIFVNPFDVLEYDRPKLWTTMFSNRYFLEDVIRMLKDGKLPLWTRILFRLRCGRFQTWCGNAPK